MGNVLLGLDTQIIRSGEVPRKCAIVLMGNWLLGRGCVGGRLILAEKAMWGSKSKETLGQRHLDCCSKTNIKVYAGEGEGKGEGRLLGTFVAFRSL